MTGRVRDYLGHIETAVSDACNFVREMDKEEFLKD